MPLNRAAVQAPAGRCRSQDRHQLGADTAGIPGFTMGIATIKVVDLACGNGTDYNHVSELLFLPA